MRRRRFLIFTLTNTDRRRMRLRKRVEKLVAAARGSVLSGDRGAALQALREAVRLDGNGGLVLQAILEIERTLAEEGPPAPPRADGPGTPGERKDSMAPDDRLEGLFASSDRAFDKGDQATAMNLLKKARKLAPDDPGVAGRIELLKPRIKSSNIVSIACRELEKGNVSRAVELSREAFDLMPDAAGLDDLLDRIERIAGPGEEGSAAADGNGDDAPDYIREIRTLVQENALEEAAARAAAAYAAHPDDELLAQFVKKFRKLGLP